MQVRRVITRMTDDDVLTCVVEALDGRRSGCCCCCSSLSPDRQQETRWQPSRRGLWSAFWEEGAGSPGRMTS